MANDQEHSRELLGELLMVETWPTLWRLIRARLAGFQAASHEDVHWQALLRLSPRASAELVVGFRSWRDRARTWATTRALMAAAREPHRIVPRGPAVLLGGVAGHQ